jgi:hypothetical protein
LDGLHHNNIEVKYLYSYISFAIYEVLLMAAGAPSIYTDAGIGRLLHAQAHNNAVLIYSQSKTTSTAMLCFGCRCHIGPSDVHSNTPKA